MTPAEIEALPPWFFPVLAFLFGACIGSFLNVCIYRMPAGKSVVAPRSSCGCGQPIAWHDNIPMLSWFLLRGRARCCGRPFPIRYPFVEFLTACLFLACWVLFPPGKAVCGWVLVSALVAATYIDLDHMIIPDVFTVGLAVAGVALAFAVPGLHVDPPGSGIFIVDAMRSLAASLQGLLVGSGLVLWIAIIAELVLKKDAMGGGDIKLVGAIGAFTGWQGGITAIFGGAIVGTVWMILAWAWRSVGGRDAKPILRTETPEGQPAEIGFGVQVPFGPMIAIAGILHFLWLHRWVEAYFEQTARMLTAVAG